jgi:hypothetical protein
MKTPITIPLVLVAAIVFALSAHPSAKGQGPKTTGAPKTKSMGSASTQTHGPKSTSGATKPVKPAKTDAKGHPKTSPTTTSSTSSTSGPGTTTSDASASTSGSTGATPNGTWVPDNPIAQKLSTKPNLMSKVQRSLNITDPNALNPATAGFKNFGNFVAAVNVSNNLGIKFDDLKAAMTGTTLAGTSTGKSPQSLGQAIQQLKPGVDSTTEAQKAQVEANVEINERSTTTEPSTKTKTTKKPSATSGSQNSQSH